MKTSWRSKCFDSMRELWYSFKRDLLPYPLGYLGKYLMRFIFKTCTVEITGLNHLEDLAQNKTILMIWHNRISIVCEFFYLYLPQRKYAAFLSKSRDGEPIARIIENYQQGTCIRVPHNKRHQALHDAISYLNTTNGVLLMTPDGPKGPRYKVKKGIIIAAQESGAPILGLSWEADHYWQLKTWDQFRLPKPFSTIKIKITGPQYIYSDEEIESITSRLENSIKSES